MNAFELGPFVSEDVKERLKLAATQQATKRANIAARSPIAGMVIEHMRWGEDEAAKSVLACTYILGAIEQLLDATELAATYFEERSEPDRADVIRETVNNFMEGVRDEPSA